MNQFNLAMHILKNDIRTYDTITSIENIPTSFELLKTQSDYTKLPLEIASWDLQCLKVHFLSRKTMMVVFN